MSWLELYLLKSGGQKYQQQVHKNEGSNHAEWTTSSVYFIIIVLYYWAWLFYYSTVMPCGVMTELIFTP